MTDCAVEGCTLQMSEHLYMDGAWVPHVPQLKTLPPPPPETENVPVGP